MSVERNIFDDTKLEVFLSFVDRQKNNVSGKQYNGFYLDAINLKNDKKTLVIQKISDNRKNIEDVWVSSVIRVIVMNPKTLCKISEISYEAYRSGKLLKEVEILYKNLKTFFGNDYMPLLIRGKTKEQKCERFIEVLNKLCAIGNTIKFDKTMSGVIQQCQSKSGISSFYSNYIVVRFNALTNHLDVDDIHLGPGSLSTMDFILSKKPKTHKGEMIVLKELHKKILEKCDIDLELYDIENQMCEFQKAYDMKEQRFKI